MEFYCCDLHHSMYCPECRGETCLSRLKKGVVEDDYKCQNPLVTVDDCQNANTVSVPKTKPDVICMTKDEWRSHIKRLTCKSVIDDRIKQVLAFSNDNNHISNVMEDMQKRVAAEFANELIKNQLMELEVCDGPWGREYTFRLNVWVDDKED